MPTSQKAKSLQREHLIPAQEDGLCKIPVAVALTTMHRMEKAVKETTREKQKEMRGRKKSGY